MNLVALGSHARGYPSALWGVLVKRHRGTGPIQHGALPSRRAGEVLPKRGLGARRFCRPKTSGLPASGARIFRSLTRGLDLGLHVRKPETNRAAKFEIGDFAFAHLRTDGVTTKAEVLPKLSIADELFL